MASLHAPAKPTLNGSDEPAVFEPPPLQLLAPRERFEYLPVPSLTSSSGKKATHLLPSTANRFCAYDVPRDEALATCRMHFLSLATPLIENTCAYLCLYFHWGCGTRGLCVDVYVEIPICSQSVCMVAYLYGILKAGSPPEVFVTSAERSLFQFASSLLLASSSCTPILCRRSFAS